VASFSKTRWFWGRAACNIPKKEGFGEDADQEATVTLGSKLNRCPETAKRSEVHKSRRAGKAGCGAIHQRLWSLGRRLECLPGGIRLAIAGIFENLTDHAAWRFIVSTGHRFLPFRAVHFYQLAFFRKPYSDQRRGNGLRTCEIAHRIKPSCFFRVARRPAVGTESHG
jgi:hypothetical protein